MLAAVVDRHRELGIAKALCAASATLGAAVLIEAALVSLLAFPPALLLARGAAPVHRPSGTGRHPPVTTPGDRM